MRLLILAAMLCFVSACSLSSSNVAVTVFPDKSGKVEVTRMLINEPDKQNAWFSGHDASNTMVVEIQHSASSFGDVEKLDVGGIKYAFARNGNGYAATATIPLTTSAAWYKNIGLSAKQIAAWTTMVEREQTRNPDEMTPQSKAFETPSVVFKITMPGLITDQRLDGMQVPAKWKMTVDGSDSGQGGEKRGATLTIPLTDVVAGAHPKLTWIVSSGATTESCKEDWKKNKTSRAAALGGK